MATAYMLFHDHELNETTIDTKLLGVYRSSDDARIAVIRFLDREGFCEAKEGFRVETPEVGYSRFPSGFVHGDDTSQSVETKLNGTSSDLLEVAYVVYHEYELPEYIDSVRFIGVFSTYDDGEAAVKAASELPGFVDQTEGFTIGTHVVGEDHWTEGYATVF